MFISSKLAKETKSKLWNRLEDQVRGNKKLWGILKLAGIWKAFIRKYAKPTDQDKIKLVIW